MGHKYLHCFPSTLLMMTNLIENCKIYAFHNRVKVAGRFFKEKIQNENIRSTTKQRIPNLRIFLTDIYYDFFFQLAN